MPLYEYRCADCGIFDAWRSLSDLSQPAHCPTCEMFGKRILSAPALLSGSFRLKQENPEPQLVKRESEPIQPRLNRYSGHRPWMIGH